MIIARFKDIKIDGCFSVCEGVLSRRFQIFMHQIKAVKPEIQWYIYQAGYEKWVRAFFSWRRYDVMTANISESMNVMLPEAREYPAF